MATSVALFVKTTYTSRANKYKTSWVTTQKKVRFLGILSFEAASFDASADHITAVAHLGGAWAHMYRA